MRQKLFLLALFASSFDLTSCASVHVSTSSEPKCHCYQLARQPRGASRPHPKGIMITFTRSLP